MWELDYKESWAPKNRCLWTVVLKKTLESPLDCKEIQPVHPEGDKSWIFIRTDVEAETPILWPPDGESWLIWKDPDVGKDWRQEEKGDDRGWDGWMASPTLWTWVWASSGNWWWTSMLQCMGSGKSHTQLSNWTELAEPWVRYNLPNSYLIGLSFSASLYSSLKRNASPHWWSLLYLSVSVWLMWDWHFHGWSWKDPVIWSWIGPSSYSERNF